MKTALRILIAALAIACAWPAASTPAETGRPAEQKIEITFDGAWVQFSAYGFQLYMPKHWVYVKDQPGAYALFLGNDASHWMQINLRDPKNMTMETIQAELGKSSLYHNVALVKINAVPFIVYEVPKNNRFGAVAMTLDGANLIDFVFSPLDDEAFGALTLEIMASISPIRE